MKKMIFLLFLCSCMHSKAADYEQEVRRINDQETVTLMYQFEQFMQGCSTREDGKLEISSLALKKWFCDSLQQPLLEITSNDRLVLKESINHQLQCLQREFRLDNAIQGDSNLYARFSDLFKKLEWWFCIERKNKIIWVEFDDNVHIKFEKTASHIINSSFIHVEKPTVLQQAQSVRESAQQYLFSRKRGRGE